MDKTLAQSLATESQDDKLDSGHAVLFPVRDETFELNGNESLKENLISIANKQVSENCGPQAIPKESVGKASPTLLESAFNVMRNLFSPEKSRNKSTNSVHENKSMPESPNNSVHLPHQQKAITLEPGIEITVVKSPFSEEHAFADKKQLNKPLLSPLPYDFISNADDSFLTTVSHNDESFQSAVTHLDENSDVTRNNGNLSISRFNNSQNLDSGDSCNSSFENSECCLENTMLKNDTASPNEINHNHSVEHKNRINDAQNLADNVEPSESGFPDGCQTIKPEALEVDRLESSSKNYNEITEVDLVVTNSTVDKNDSPEFIPNIMLNNTQEISDQQAQPVFEQQVTSQSPQCLSNNFDFVKTNNENKTVLDGNVNCDLGEAIKNETPNELITEGILQNSFNYTVTHLTKDDLNEVDEMLVVLKKEDATSTFDVINGNRNLIESGSAVESSPVGKSVKTPGKTSRQKRKSHGPLRSDNSKVENNDGKQMKQLMDLSPGIHTEAVSVESHKDVELKIPENFTEGIKDDKEIKCEDNEFGPEIMPQRSYTVLCADSNLKRPVINSSSDVSTNDLLNSTPMNVAHIEYVQNDTAFESAKASPIDSPSMFSVKHSTPVLNGNTCSDAQNLDMNSLEINTQINSSADNPVQKESGRSSLIDTSKPEELNMITHVLDKPKIQISKENSLPYDKKEEKFESPRFDETFVNALDCSRGELKESVMNKTYDKEPNKHNLTFSKTDTADLQKSNSPTANELNISYVKEMNKISEKNVTQGFVNDRERSGCSEFPDIKHFLSPIKEPSEPMGQIPCISLNEVMSENIDGYKSIDAISYTEGNHSFLSGTSSTSPGTSDTSIVKNQKPTSDTKAMDVLSGKLEKVHLDEFPRELLPKREPPPGESKSPSGTTFAVEFFSKNDEAELAQFIEQQFTPTDIDKICDVAALSENLNDEFLNENEIKVANILSPKGFEFLSSIQGKPTGRDLSRESLYVKFDPLVQPSSANSLIDFTKEVQVLEASATPPADLNSSICEELLSISPEKKSDAIVPPLTPLSDRSKPNKTERIKELQNEIYFLKNLYSERERSNKAKMDEYESQIAKLTADKCVFEDQLKEYGEREKSLVKKMTTQSEGIARLKNVLEQYIVTLTNIGIERDTLKEEKLRQTEALTSERDWYMKHLQNTEAAFTDVHSKYEKSKKTIESLKTNAAQYERLIAEYKQKEEMFEKGFAKYKTDKEKEVDNIMKQLHKTENIHNQEVARLRAQLKKTELKLEAVQESLDQKIKENQQLTAICDELIEGKKEIRK